MKKMTCKQLGGACAFGFQASTFEEMAELSKKHSVELGQKGDKEHIDAMQKMRTLMQSPQKMKEWMEEKRKEFNAL